MKRPRMRDRLWWFDLVYPIAVAAILFASLTYIVYAGQRSSRLALMAEQEILEFSLERAAPRPAVKPGVLTVLVDPSDVRRFGRAPYGAAPEVSAAVYARAIEALATAGAKTIFVRWDAFAHQTDEVYYLPLTHALEKIRGHSEVFLVAPTSKVDAVPEPVAKLAKVLDDFACHEPERLQSNCPYQANWDSWVLTVLLQRALPGAMPPMPKLDDDDAGERGPLAPWLTMKLPSFPPSYILNLSPPQSLRRMTLGSLLDGDPIPAGTRFAFVGPDQSHTLSGVVPSPLDRFVRTVFDEKSVDVNIAGTPLTVFWAQLAQMIVDDALVRIPSETTVVVVTAALCLLIIVVMVLFGGAPASGMFVVYVALGPFVNGWTLSKLDIYLPLFDSYYFGLFTFIFAGFGRLSITAFQRWRLEEERRMHAHTADLKGNFISLLSHNLNTPVAKMQGMLALLSQHPGEAPWKGDVRHAESHVAQLELAIRGVLIASALEEGSTAETSRNALFIVDDLRRGMTGSLRRLGVTVVLGEAAAENEDELLLPLGFDLRALQAATASLSALYREGAQSAAQVRVEVDFFVSTDAAGSWLTVTFSSADGWIPASAEAVLTAGVVRPLRSLAGASFYADVLAGLAVLTVKTYGGTLRLRKDDGVIEARLKAVGTSVAT